MEKKKKMSVSYGRIYEAARYAILGLVLFTVGNVLLQLIGSETYYVSSVFSVYFFSLSLAESFVSLILAVVLLTPFILAFIFSKKKWGWMIVALVLVVLDLVLLVLLALYADMLVYQILDIIAHIVVIVLLILAVVHGKAATAAPTEQPAAAEMPIHNAYTIDPAAQPYVNSIEAPQRSAQSPEGAFTDVVCTVAVSQDGQRHSMEAQGLARFYDNKLAIGASSFAATMLIGSAFAPTKEQLQFAYSDIARVYYAKKNERTVRIDLLDGRYVFLIVNSSARERLIALFGQHGIMIEPFAEQPKN